MKTTPKHLAVGKPGFTIMELLVVVAIIVVLAAISFSVVKNLREEAQLTKTSEKIKALGQAFVTYTTDSGGLLPLEDAPGSDDWDTAQSDEAKEAWYNALPILMSHSSVGELADNPERFYTESYPLYVPGAPYPKGDKKLTRPRFAIAMNSRLQRKDDNEIKELGTLASIQDPVRTVVFLERGLKDDKKVSKAQRGFNGKPKANPRAFAARHNGKGLLLFADGHLEARTVFDLIDKTGRINYPQERIIWTRDPLEDPN